MQITRQQTVANQCNHGSRRKKRCTYAVGRHCLVEGGLCLKCGADDIVYQEHRNTDHIKGGFYRETCRRCR